MTPAELIAALEALSPDEFTTAQRAQLQALADRRDKFCLSVLDRAYVDALVIYKDLQAAGGEIEESFERAAKSNRIVTKHNFSFQNIAVKGNRRDLHAIANKIRKA